MPPRFWQFFLLHVSSFLFTPAGKLFWTRTSFDNDHGHIVRPDRCLVPTQVAPHILVLPQVANRVRYVAITCVGRRNLLKLGVERLISRGVLREGGAPGKSIISHVTFSFAG